MKLKVDKKSLKEQVREILFQKIITGEFQPEERLKIIPIAESLGVSQAPVREAIQCLVTGGYLELVPNAGARVKKFSEEEIAEIYELRRLIEVGSIRNPSFRPQAVAETLETHFQKMQEAVHENSYKNYSIHNTAFHRCIVKASDNVKMLQVWDSLAIPQYVASIIKRIRAELKDVADLHIPVIRELKKGDKEEAVKALIHHYDFLEISKS